MESLLVLLLYGTPLAIALLVYVVRRGRHQSDAAERLRESVASGLSEPASLHPVVDPTLCLASGVCVRACPEQALGIVAGKAVLVNASACIGHGACAAACPTEAIRLVFGTERRGVDIPEVKPNFETNVAGIFIAGELGGMGLIRKAAEQGRQAIESIRASARRSEGADVVIVGAGPAGIAAGLGAIEHKLRYVLLEQEDALGGAVYHYPRNKLTMTAPFEFPIVGKVNLGPEVRKEALLEVWTDIIQRTGLNVRFREKMEQVERVDDGFLVRTTRGSYRAGAVLLAIGRRGTPRKLGVPGEELPKVVYRLVDPEQYRGADVLVVGGGDSALEAAIALANQPACRVTLSYRSEAFSRVKPANRRRLESLEAARSVRVVMCSTVRKIGARDVVLDRDGEGIQLPNDAVIVCAGGELPFELLRRAGIAFQTHRGEEPAGR